MGKLQLIATLLTTIIEGLFYSGVVYGWASVYDIFISEGFFLDDDLNSTSARNISDAAALSQAEKLNLVFTISTSITPMINIFTGTLMDKKGIWVARTLTLTMNALGYLLIALSHSMSSQILFIAIPLLDIGGYGLLTINSQIGNLYPRYRSTVITTMCGCFISSTITFFIFNHLYFVHGFSFRNIFLAGSLLSIPLQIRTFLLMPRHSVPRSIPSNYQYGYNELPGFRKKSSPVMDSLEEKVDLNGNMIVKDTTVVMDDRSFKECLLSRDMITNVIHFCVVQFGLIYFLGNFNSWIVSVLGDENKEVLHHNTAVYSMIQSCGVLVSPLCGALMDVLYRKFAAKREAKFASIKSAAVAMLFGDLFLMLLFSSSVVTIYGFQYLTYVFVILSRSFVYGSLGSFIGNNYPAQHFGKLYGVSVGAGGLVLLLQYPTTLISGRFLNSDYSSINYFFLGLSAIASIHPISTLMYLTRAAPDITSKSSSEDMRLVVGEEAAA